MTSHFKNSIKAILDVSRCSSFYLSLIYHFFYFVNVLFIFISVFDLMLILLKNNLNINKNHLGSAVLI